MNYSLGNMLGGSNGSLNPDKLSLNLQFATDKTLTARKGPTPTFTRASNATYYGPLVDYGFITGLVSDVISSNRSRWAGNNGSTFIIIYYDETRWVISVDQGEITEYFAALGSEFRPEQANWSASGAPFTPTTSSTFGLVRAGVNEPRFDHATTAPNACRGLLIEESRTNNLTRSDDFAQAIWTKLNTTVTSNNTTSPDGTNNADSIFETTALGEHTIYFSSSSLADATMSIFVKPNGRNNISLRFYAGINNWVTTTFLLSGAGSITQTSSGSSSTYTGRSQTITQLLNGWYRCTLSASRTGGVNIISFDLCRTSTPTLTTSGAESYTGNTSLGFHLWGAQLEAGAFPTSYIPTTTASVVRSADVCSITGSAFTSLWNATEGTIFSGFTIYGSTTYGAVITADPASDIGKIQISKASLTQADIGIKDVSNNVVFSYSPTSSLTTGLNKAALAYKANDSIATVNNLSSALDTSVTLGTQTQILIGNDSIGGGRRINGAIASIRVYKKRLSLAKLQTLTV